MVKPVQPFPFLSLKNNFYFYALKLTILKKLLISIFILFSIVCYSERSNDTIQKWKINGKLTFLFNQSSFTNWSSGGQNTVSGNINVDYTINYKKGNFNWDNKVVTAYGLSHISEKGRRKTDDRFELNSILGYKSGGNRFFSFFTNFNTQFTRGYDYKKTPKEAVSTFFSPAYLSFGPGLLWKKSDNITINLAPATSRFTFVSEEFSGKYGVDLGDNSSYSLGFNLSSTAKFTLMKNVTMENILVVYSDYLQKPENIDVNYQGNFLFKVNQYLSMNLTLHTVYDDNASSSLQVRQVFGLGVNYLFHKK